MRALGLDLGGSKLLACVVDGDGRVLGRAIRPTGRATGPEQARRLVVEVAAELRETTGPFDAAGLGFEIRPGNAATFVDFGSLITAAITFLITAAVVYFVFVVPMNHAAARVRARAEVQEPAAEPTPVDVALLTEMRDLLQRIDSRNGHL